MVECCLQQPRSEFRYLACRGMVVPEEYSDSAGATSQIWKKLCPMGTHSRSQLCFSWGWLHLFPFMQEKHFIRALCNLMLGNTGHSWFHQMMNQWVPLLLHTSYSKVLGGFLDKHLGSSERLVWYGSLGHSHTIIQALLTKCSLTSLSIKLKPSFLLLFKIKKPLYHSISWNAGTHTHTKMYPTMRLKKVS